MKELNVIPFTLSFLYILSNLRNYDNSVPTVNEIDSKGGVYEKLGFISLIDFFQSNTVMIGFLILGTLFSVILEIIGNKVVIKVFNGLFLTIAIIMFVSSTIMYNSTNKKDCKTTQLSIKRKYSEDEEKDTEDKEDKEDKIKLDTFDSSVGYTFVYIFGLILLIGSYLKDKSINKISILYVILYFILGLLFQLFTSFILRFFHDKKSWPSIFTYLDEFIINNSRNELFSRIIGMVRLLLILVSCIFVGYNFSIKKSFSVNNVIKMISIIYLIFTAFITSWQTLLGDGCIMDRTMSKYTTGDKRSGPIDINFNIFNEQWGKPFKNILYCSIGNQLGIYFHLLLMAMISIFI